MSHIISTPPDVDMGPSEAPVNASGIPSPAGSSPSHLIEGGGSESASPLASSTDRQFIWGGQSPSNTHAEPGGSLRPHSVPIEHDTTPRRNNLPPRLSERGRYNSLKRSRMPVTEEEVEENHSHDKTDETVVEDKECTCLTITKVRIVESKMMRTQIAVLEHKLEDARGSYALSVYERDCLKAKVSDLSALLEQSNVVQESALVLVTNAQNLQDTTESLEVENELLRNEQGENALEVTQRLEAVHGAAQKEASTHIGALEKKLANAEEKVERVNAQLDGTKAHVEALQVNQEETSSRIHRLKEELARAEADAAKTSTQLHNAETAHAEASQAASIRIDGLEAELTSVRLDNEKEKAQMEALQADQKETSDLVLLLKEKLASAEADIEKANTQLHDAETAHAKALQAVSNHTRALEEELASAEEKLTSAEADIEKANARLHDAETAHAEALQTVSNRTFTLGEELASVEEKLTSAEADVEKANAQLHDVETAHTEASQLASSRIYELEKELASKAHMEALQADQKETSDLILSLKEKLASAEANVEKADAQLHNIETTYVETLRDASNRIDGLKGELASARGDIEREKTCVEALQVDQKETSDLVYLLKEKLASAEADVEKANAQLHNAETVHAEALQAAFNRIEEAEVYTATLQANQEETSGYVHTLKEKLASAEANVEKANAQLHNAETTHAEALQAASNRTSTLEAKLASAKEDIEKAKAHVELLQVAKEEATAQFHAKSDEAECMRGQLNEAFIRAHEWMECAAKHQNMIQAHNKAHEEEVQKRLTELMKIEQEKWKVVNEAAAQAELNQAMTTQRIQMSEDAERARAEIMQKLEATKLELERQKNVNKQVETSGSGTTQDPIDSTLSERAREKRPESSVPLRLQAGTLAPRLTLQHPTSNMRARDCIQNIGPPRRIRRPFGADTPLSQRLRLRSPAVEPQGRAQSPSPSSHNSNGTTSYNSSDIPNGNWTPNPSTVPTTNSLNFPGPGVGPLPEMHQGSSGLGNSTSGTSSFPTPPESLESQVHRLTSQYVDIERKIEGLQKNNISPSSSRSRRPKMFRVNQSPRPSNIERNAMINIACPVMNQLLNIKHDADIIDVVYDHMASPEDMEMHSRGMIIPSLNPLRIHWDDKDSSWNKTLSSTFANHITDQHESLNSIEVAGYFVQRIGTLKRILVGSVPHDGESDEQVRARSNLEKQNSLKTKRIRARKARLFENRLSICTDGSLDNNEAWKLLYYMVDTLGVGGNSSDESDGETFTVRYKEWRSSEVQALLEFIDRNRKTTNDFGTNLPGGRAHPRVRRRTAPCSTNCAIAGLPRNFYDDVWYDSLLDIEQIDLNAGDSITLPEVE